VSIAAVITVGVVLVVITISVTLFIVRGIMGVFQ